MRFIGIVLAVCLATSAYGADYSVLESDKSVSDVYKRWAKLTNRTVIWDPVMSVDSKIVSVDFDIINADKINKQIKDHNNFKDAVTAVAHYYGQAHPEVYTQVCLYEEGEIALWVHSSHILNCNEVVSAYPELK